MNNSHQNKLKKTFWGVVQGARVAAGPFKMSAEAMKEAKGKAETAWSLGLCPICHESIKGGKVLEGKQMWKKLGVWGWGCRVGVVSCFYLFSLLLLFFFPG